MVHQVLAPGMEHAEETDLRSQVIRTGGNFQESCSAGSKQKAVEKLLVVEDQRSQPVGNGKDQVHIGNIQEFLLARGQPLPAGIAETPRAMPIAAAVVRDGDDMAARTTTIAVPAKSCRATVLDGVEHLAVQPGHPRALSFDEAFACRSNDVSHLQRRPIHGSRFFLERLTPDRSDTASSSSGFGQA